MLLINDLMLESNLDMVGLCETWLNEMKVPQLTIASPMLLRPLNRAEMLP